MENNMKQLLFIRGVYAIFGNMLREKIVLFSVSTCFSYPINTRHKSRNQ
jgi:hypothetical protein